MIVEAAVLLPVFLFSVVLVIYTIKIMHFQEIVHFESCENLAVLSWESQLGGESFGERMFESKLYHDVQDKVDKEINITAEIEETDDIYIAEISFPVELDLPFGLFDDIKIRDVAAARKWSGSSSVHNSMGFTAMEQEDENEYVFIFPRYGERYHKGDCRYLSIEGRFFESVQYVEALSKGYMGCEVCQ